MVRNELRLPKATTERRTVASHVQTQQRQPERAPGVLHRARPGSVPKRQMLVYSDGSERYLQWRAASAVLFLLLGALLAIFFVSDVFFVRSIVVRGNDLMPREEIFAYSDIADFHMFWLDPAQIRENILRSPSVADVVVQLGWPPDLITILVQERQPAMIWSDAGVESWIDLQGRTMPARAEMPHVPRVNLVNDDYAGSMPSAEDFTADMVLGALQLIERLPAGTNLDFHPVHGLGWTNEQGWQVWMGRGSASETNEKLQMYEVLVADLNNRAVDIAELNIANPDAPFYRVLWER